MAILTFFEGFSLDLAKGVHDFDTHVFMLALSNAANQPSAAADIALADFTQIAYTNLVGRTVTVSSVAQAGGITTIVIDDFDLEASGGAVAAFRYISLYNDTSTGDRLVGYYDIGSEVTLLDTQVLPLDFNAVSGAIQIAPA